MLFAHYLPEQADRLRRRMQAPEWRQALAECDLEAWRARLCPAPTAPGQLGAVARYLVERNGDRVRRMVAEEQREEEVLLRALADWSTALEGGERFPILFLGLVLTLECSFHPRCAYCNQAVLPRVVSLERWKELIVEAVDPVPPYIYLTGGEPLLLGEELWGDGGLVPFAAGLGCAVNINTNAALITPEVALRLVRGGLARLHVSLDSAEPRTQALLFGAEGRAEEVIAGLENILVARELLGAGHPQIHVNCVLTRVNLFGVPELLRLLFRMRRVRSVGAEGLEQVERSLGDFAFHLIPVGGPSNAPLRPTAEEWRRFYTETWAEAEEVWRSHQTEIGIPEGERSVLEAQVPFANPFRRADHHMTLEEYCELAARGNYWQGALGERCYLAPSQAFVLADGSQHWCGAHAIRRPEPLGDVAGAGLRENIRRGLGRLAELPQEACASCAGATCVINQSVDRALRGQIAEWLKAA